MSFFGKPSGGEPRITYERIDLAVEPVEDRMESLPAATARNLGERLEPRIERTKQAAEECAEAGMMLVAADSEMEGRLRSQGAVRVQGVLRGTLHAPLLLLEPGGLIEGTVHVERARLCGTLRGTVIAREVEVIRTAALDAELVYDEISIERGARVRGLHRQRDPEPPPAEAPPVAEAVPQPVAQDAPAAEVEVLDPALLSVAAASTAALVAEAEAALQELAQATQAAAGAVTELAQDGIQELVELEAELRDTPEQILRDTLAA